VCLHERNGSGADSREDINCSGMDRIRGRAEGRKLEVEHKAGSDGIILHGGYSCTLCLRSVCQLLPRFQNIRCFSFVKQMHLDIF
jgi:hypothetical protein